MRLFIALEIPAAAREAAAAAQAALRAATRCPVSWTRPEGMHLTLQFLGEAPAELVPALLAALAALPPPALSLGLAPAGAFPNPRRPRVLWLGLAGDLAALGGLQRAVLAATGPLGFPPEDKPFRPHLTLGRVRPEARQPQLGELEAALAALPPPPPVGWAAGRPTLFQSELTPRGAIYTTLGPA